MFQLPLIALYFVALAVWSGFNAADDGYGAGGIAVSALSMLSIGAALMGTLSLLALWVDRTTIYTITSERVVIRYGLALQMTVNFPFRVVEEATLKVFKSGTGNVNLRLIPGHGVAWLMLWPHVRPWKWARTQPMLRGVENAREAAEVLARALSSHATKDLPAETAGDQVRLGVRETEGEDTSTAAAGSGEEQSRDATVGPAGSVAGGAS